MPLIDKFTKACDLKDETFKECLRLSGPFAIGPTARGGFYVRCNNKDVKSDMSVKELKELRDLINSFLKEVLGE